MIQLAAQAAATGGRGSGGRILSLGLNRGIRGIRGIPGNGTNRAGLDLCSTRAWGKDDGS